MAQTSIDAAYLSRHVALKSGLRETSTALTINRLCGSGFQSVINGMQEIGAGDARVVLCGGAESMSQSPLSSFGHECRFGVNLGTGLNLQDTLWSALTDAHVKLPMGVTAENLAQEYAISRLECDAFALRSQERWAKASKAGVFDAEMAPIELKSRKGTEVCQVDEHPRETTLEKLSQLKPVFQKEGTVTAANASGICDGAGTIIIASEEAVKEHQLTPLARIVSYAVSGVDPKIMVCRTH